MRGIGGRGGGQMEREKKPERIRDCCASKCMLISITVNISVQELMVYSKEKCRGCGFGGVNAILPRT